MCDLKRYRSRVCESKPCEGIYVESKECACVPLDAAGMYRSRIYITFIINISFELIHEIYIRITIKTETFVKQ